MGSTPGIEIQDQPDEPGAGQPDVLDFAVAVPSLRFFGGLHVYCTDQTLDFGTGTLRAFFPVPIMHLHRLQKIELVPTFLALEFIDGHGYASRSA